MYGGMSKAEIWDSVVVSFEVKLNLGKISVHKSCLFMLTQSSVRVAL